MCGPHIAIAPDDPRDRPAVGLAGYDLPFSLQTLYIRRVGLLPAHRRQRHLWRRSESAAEV